ncbi:endonuclease Q family protein, partial [Patescibacteria group bacterium]|nr:endonuclease Q family protein [Patescibacteria group bacterium]
AVSQQMVIPEIAKWAKRKGIGLVTTTDFTHPLWLRELKENLVEAGDGIYRYKDKPTDVLFLLTTEISSIYSQGGRGHRIHNLVFAPNFETVGKISEQLRGYGIKLLSDGRPMTGLSSIELCDLVFSISKDCLIIPAHAWTPWYSLYGSNSGFDSIEECFGKFSDQIHAIETGLSSDPAMNWRIEELDSRSIVSFSDAHSPKKLGREATVFEMEKQFNYQDIKNAIQEQKITYTIEFYPEEGKYHYTGHRNCGVKQSPEETKKLGAICPVCGRKLTVGVMHRVEELAKRPVDYQPKNRPPYKMLVPLMEILSEALGVGVSSQMVETEYNRLTERFESEFDVLLKTDPLEIAKISGEKVAQGIKRVREREIVVDPGYDGVFGTVKIWGEQKEEEKKQMSLF